MKYQIKPALTIMFAMALSFASCSGDSGNGPDDSVINIAAISGITVPVAGAAPVTAITETDQYTGTVAWSGTPVTFAGSTVYTATITLTAKSGYTLNGVDENFFTVTGATTVSNSADSGVITASFPETGILLSVGDSFGGGIVAYILQSGDPGYVEGEQHGLIVATADRSGVCWISGGSTQTTSLSEWTGTAIGTGSANTDKIIADAEAAGNYTPGSYAAGLARANDDGGYTDWYLPSKDELNKLYLNREAIGGFSSIDFYWSSSQSDYTNSGPVYIYAWAQSLINDGYQYAVGSKNATYLVRPVRSF